MDVIHVKTAEYKNYTFHDTIFIVRGRMRVSNVDFQECIFIASHDLRDCVLELSGSAIFSKCRFVRGSINACSGRFEFVDCRFFFMNGSSVSVEGNSWCFFDGCLFWGNGSWDVLSPQVLVSGSEVRVSKCIVINGANSLFLESEEGRVHIRDSMLCGNEAGGVAFYSSTVELSNCRVVGNGREDGGFAQIYIEDSLARLERVHVRGGIGSDGIVAAKESRVELIGCEVLDHTGNGVVIERGSVVSMRGCSICCNGSEVEETLQVWIDSSKVSIQDSIVADGVCGIYVQKGGLLSVVDSVVRNNRGAICVFDSSEARIRGCSFVGNMGEQQVWLRGSKVWIEDSELVESDGVDVRAEEMVLIHVENVRVSGAIYISDDSRNVRLNFHRV